MKKRVCSVQSEPISSLYIIQKGRVRLSYAADLMGRSPNMYSLMTANQVENHGEKHGELSIEKDEGSYFGEWGILGEDIGSISATSIGDVVCLVLTREKFESAIGPLAVLTRDDNKYVSL